MLDKAHRQTDSILESLELKISAVYQQAESEVKEKWEEYLKEVDDQTKDLKNKIKAAKNESDKLDYQKQISDIYKDRTIMNQYYQELLQEIALQYQHSAETAVAIVNGKLPKVYSVNYNFMGDKIVNSLDDIDIMFNLVDTQTVKNLLLDDASLFPTLEINGNQYTRWVTSTVNGQVLSGIIQGESMDKIAARLQKVTKMTARAAITNARTAVTSAENKGRLDSMQTLEKQGVVLQKEWLSTSDARTRDWHRELNGKSTDIDKPFENSVGKIMYPGDPGAAAANVYNCRCTLLTRVKGFKKVR